MNSKKTLEQFRKYLINNIDKVIFKNTNRGPIAFINETVVEHYNINCKVDNTPLAIKHEARMLTDGNLNELLKTHWWENDNELAAAYIDLFQQLKNWKHENVFSRNIVACNKQCCYSWVQKLDDKLIVVARSTDVGKGYIWDVAMAKFLASVYDCKALTMIFLHKHAYLRNFMDSNWIARRGADVETVDDFFRTPAPKNLKKLRDKYISDFWKLKIKN